jgi:hypothetical protein
VYNAKKNWWQGKTDEKSSNFSSETMQAEDNGVTSLTF